MNLPNKLSLSRMILVVFLYLTLFILSFFKLDEIYLFGPKEAPVTLIYLIVLIVFVLASFTDFLDGYIARKNNLITDFGKFIDPIADKMLVNSTLIFLCSSECFATNQMGISVYVVIMFIFRDLVVDGVRFMAAKNNVVIAANIFGKLKTVLQMVAIPVVLLNGFPFSYFDANWIEGLRIADILVYVALFFSLLSGVIYVYSNRSAFNKSK